MSATDTYLGLRAFVDELARCGVTHACTSPGSRSTPLVLSLARDDRFTVSSHIDERSGAFYALGIAKATGRPAVLACTSGTAAANYAPAVIEAYEARVPLLVLTADRPPELRDVGAGQTIDQVKLYGRAAKWYLEIDEAPATEERMRFMRRLACRATWTTTSGRRGPVHLNFALREPLVLEDSLPRSEPGGGGRKDGRAWTEQYPPAPAAPDLALTGRDPVLVAGAGAPGDAVAAFAAQHRWPVLADPLSGARRGEAAIAHYDALLRIPNWGEGFAPDLVVRIGDLPTSKPLRQWLGNLPGVRQIALDPTGAWQDPDASVWEIHPAGAEALNAEPLDGRWLDGWREADAVARQALAGVLGGELSEPAVAIRTAAALGPHDTLVVASSMPVRDLETFAVTGARVLANRGANGIDGTVSTALGVAAATGGRTVLLTGDVAVLHDAGGLIGARRLEADLTIVLVNNDGGGIFHFLPVAGEQDHFERHVGTPHGTDFAALGALGGFTHRQVATAEALDAGLADGGRAILEIRTNRADNVKLHRRAWAAVARAVSDRT
jgi:2-succinyl-5-enolpyruvyl-6-hydroxy-3-cyclohexene-1-carboxylate synthase